MWRGELWRCLGRFCLHKSIGLRRSSKLWMIRWLSWIAFVSKLNFGNKKWCNIPSSGCFLNSDGWTFKWTWNNGHVKCSLGMLNTSQEWPYDFVKNRMQMEVDTELLLSKVLCCFGGLCIPLIICMVEFLVSIVLRRWHWWYAMATHEIIKYDWSNGLR